MLSDWVIRSLRRVLFASLLLALLASPADLSPVLPLPAPVQAAPNTEIVLNFDILAVKAGTSVTVRLKDFPVRTSFSVRMARVGKKALDGEVIAEFNTEKGGTFEATYPIPEKLKNELILAIRFDSPDHYTANYWFFNRDLLRKPDAASQPVLSFADARKGATFTLKASNLVPNASYRVRVGPHYTFYRDYMFLPSLQADASGALTATLSLPERSKNAEFVMVRLDGGGTYITGSYKNVDGGGAVPAKDLVKVVRCTLLDIKPLPAFEPGEEFDAVWTVQNTSNWEWTSRHLYYRYTSGERIHKYADIFPVGWTVKRGNHLQVTVDMIAPQQAGWHRTVWTVALVGDGGLNDTLCKLPISIFVKGQ